MLRLPLENTSCRSRFSSRMICRFLTTLGRIRGRCIGCRCSPSVNNYIAYHTTLALHVPLYGTAKILVPAPNATSILYFTLGRKVINPTLRVICLIQRTQQSKPTKLPLNKKNDTIIESPHLNNTGVTYHT